MIPLALAEVARATAGVAHGDASVSGAAIDSREVSPGDLFVALPGERTDGHDHLAAARRAGATAALVGRLVDDPLPQVVVPDPQAGMALLAREVLRRMPEVSVVGITGSSGKTTTKDLLAQVLAGAGPVHAPPGSHNNEVGLPLTVLRTPVGTRHLVLEYGARGVGHIRHLTQIAPPDVAVVLNVGSAHLGEFGSREALATAKAELLDGDGTAVLNADDPVVRAMATRRRVLLAGEAADAAVRVVDVVLEAGRGRFRLAYEGDTAEVALQQVGRHLVADAACAAAAALACGMALADVAVRLSAASPRSAWRMEVTERADGLTVVNDAYNANPESVRAALDALVALAGPRRSWAVLGEMRELGERSAELHAAVAAHARSVGVDEVVAVGGEAVEALGGVRVPDVAAALAHLRGSVGPGDVVLVKASRSAGLERVALGLLGGAGQGGEP